MFDQIMCSTTLVAFLTLPWDVVTLKILLPFHGTGVVNVAAIRHAFTGKQRYLYFLRTLIYSKNLGFIDVTGNI